VHSDDGGTSHIAVPNPRDANQIFKFPYVVGGDARSAIAG
jgi:hypothetical protein